MIQGDLEGSLSGPKAGENHMVRRNLCNKRVDEELVLRRSLFKTYNEPGLIWFPLPEMLCIKFKYLRLIYSIYFYDGITLMKFCVIICLWIVVIFCWVDLGNKIDVLYMMED